MDVQRFVLVFLVGWFAVVQAEATVVDPKVPHLTDVGVTHPARTWVESSFWAGAFRMPGGDMEETIGCVSGAGEVNFCPDGEVKAVQLAFILLRAKHGADYMPTYTGTAACFDDIGPGHWAYTWVCDAKEQGILVPQLGNKLRPAFTVSREYFAEVLLNAVAGEDYTPISSDHADAVQLGYLAPCPAGSPLCGAAARVKRSTVAVALAQAFRFPRFQKVRSVRFNPQGTYDGGVELNATWLTGYDTPGLRQVVQEEMESLRDFTELETLFINLNAGRHLSISPTAAELDRLIHFINDANRRGFRVILNAGQPCHYPSSIATPLPTITSTTQCSDFPPPGVTAAEFWKNGPLGSPPGGPYHVGGQGGGSGVVLGFRCFENISWTIPSCSSALDTNGRPEFLVQAENFYSAIFDALAKTVGERDPYLINPLGVAYVNLAGSPTSPFASEISYLRRDFSGTNRDFLRLNDGPEAGAAYLESMVPFAQAGTELPIGLRFNPFQQAGSTSAQLLEAFDNVLEVLVTYAGGDLADVDYYEFSQLYGACESEFAGSDAATIFALCSTFFDYDDVLAAMDDGSTQDVRDRLVISDTGVTGAMEKDDAVAFFLEEAADFGFGGFTIWQYRGGIRGEFIPNNLPATDCYGNNNECWEANRLQSIEDFPVDVLPYLD